MAATATTAEAAGRAQLLSLARGMDQGHPALQEFWQALTNPHMRPVCLSGKNDETAYNVALATVAVLGFLHVQRLVWALLSDGDGYRSFESLLRELVISLISLTGLALFWHDVQRCQMSQGLVRLLAIEGFANIILPCMWTVTPPRRRRRPEEEEKDNSSS